MQAVKSFFSNPNNRLCTMVGVIMLFVLLSAWAAFTRSDQVAASEIEPAAAPELVTEVPAVELPAARAALPESLQIRANEIQWGNPAAPVQIIEYASLTCGHCADFHLNTWPQVKKELVQSGDVHFVFRFLPWDNLALAASKIVACGRGEQRNLLLSAFFQTQAEWARSDQPLDVLKQNAQLAGMTADEVDACIADEEIHQQLIDQRNVAVEELNLRSTPTFIINVERLVGNQPASALKATVERVSTD